MRLVDSSYCEMWIYIGNKGVYSCQCWPFASFPSYYRWCVAVFSFLEKPITKTYRAYINKEAAFYEKNKTKTTSSRRRQKQNDHQMKYKISKPQKHRPPNATEDKRCKLGKGMTFPQRCLQEGKQHPQMPSTLTREPRFFN